MTSVVPVPFRIELVAGETQSQKRFLIRGVSRDELKTRLAAALADRRS